VVELRKSLLWVALYLSIVIILGALDLENVPVINFASYFYITAIIIVPIILLLPAQFKIPLYVLIVLTAIIYFLLGRVIDRAYTGSANLEVIVLELVFVEVGVGLSFQLASVISHSESLIEFLAQGTFPNRALDLNAAADRIKTEFNRSRRYQRQISILVIHIFPQSNEATDNNHRSMQKDILDSLSLARMAHIINDCIRQTDLLMRDHIGQFIILCTETSSESAFRLARRIQEATLEKAGFEMRYGISAFPEEALTFEDLLFNARERLNQRVRAVIREPEHQVSER
jgi:GGDEF domain-containing protein